MGLLDQTLPNENSANPSEMKAAIEARLKIESRLNVGASWFFWVAGLSIINSVIVLVGGDWSFLFGLGATQFVDAFMRGIGESVPAAGPVVKVIGFGINLGIMLLFVLLGSRAKQRQRWAFITGMGLYAADGLIFLLIAEYLGLAFHVWVLFGIYGGLKAADELAQLPPEPPPLPSPTT